MNASERRTIRQAMARIQTGDRSGAREVLAALAGRPTFGPVRRTHHGKRGGGDLRLTEVERAKLAGRIKYYADLGHWVALCAIARAVAPPEVEDTPTEAPESDQGQVPLPLLDLHIDCVTLRCSVPVGVCIARQAVTDVQRTQQASRGQGTDYPHCDSRKCEQGRSIRATFDVCGSISWRGAGPGGRFAKDRPAAEREAQRAVRERMRLVGMLDEVPTLDAMPGEVEE